MFCSLLDLKVGTFLSWSAFHGFVLFGLLVLGVWSSPGLQLTSSEAAVASLLHFFVTWLCLAVWGTSLLDPFRKIWESFDFLPGLIFGVLKVPLLH